MQLEDELKFKYLGEIGYMEDQQLLREKEQDQLQNQGH